MKKNRRILPGVGVALAVYLGLLALLAFLTVRGTVPEQAAWPLACAAACLASFAGASAAARGEAAPLGAITICAAAFWGVVQLLGFGTNDALDPARSAVLALSVGVGAGLACLTAGKRKKHTGGRRRRQTHRRGRGGE